MPLIDIAPFEVLTPALERGARAKVFGLMLWPNDEHKRFDFVISNVQDFAQSIAIANNTGLEIHTDFARLLHEKSIVPPRIMLQNAWQPVVYGAAKSPNAPELTPGQVAGQILIHATNRLKEGHKNIGLNDCLERVSQDLRREGAMNVRPKELKHHWHNFRSVSPLWASFLTAIRYQQVGIQPKPGLEFATLLIRAEMFRWDGEAIMHRNAAEPLLPQGSVWQLPDDVKECLLRSQGT